MACFSACDAVLPMGSSSFGIAMPPSLTDTATSTQCKPPPFPLVGLSPDMLTGNRSVWPLQSWWSSRPWCLNTRRARFLEVAIHFACSGEPFALVLGTGPSSRVSIGEKKTTFADSLRALHVRPTKNTSMILSLYQSWLLRIANSLSKTVRPWMEKTAWNLSVRRTSRPWRTLARTLCSITSQEANSNSVVLGASSRELAAFFSPPSGSKMSSIPSKDLKKAASSSSDSMPTSGAAVTRNSMSSSSDEMLITSTLSCTASRVGRRAPRADTQTSSVPVPGR
mmetsp:Transcript_2811/g.9903  ORF Transcript_2811/g.9903 Transcript_2811/m.9903 type:complete len:281 (+) Transcript_2811:640-1482(+)